MKTSIRIFIMLNLLMIWAGCATVPLTPPISGITPGKQFAPIPEDMFGAVDAKKARLFFITNIDQNVLGIDSRGDIRITDGNTVIGDLQNASYLCWERDPGVTIVKYTMPGQENADNWFIRNFSTYKIKAEGGQIYYLFLGGLTQRHILLAQDAKAFLAAYPRPLAGSVSATPIALTTSNAIASNQTSSAASQKPV